MSACRGLDVMMGSGARGAAARCPPPPSSPRTSRVVTEVSRREVTGGDAIVSEARARRAPSAVAGAGALLSRRAPRSRRVAALGLVGAYAAVVGRAHADADRATRRRRACRRAVGAGILGLIPLEAGLLAGSGSLVPAAGVAALWPLARRAVEEARAVDVSLQFGYVSNGLSDHRLEHALELLAENGYAGIALTLDHIHFDPFAPRLRARARAPARGTGGARALLRGGDRRALRAGPAAQALPDAAVRRAPEARRPAVHGGRRRGRARRAGRLDVVGRRARRASRPSARGTCWSTAASACSRTRTPAAITLAFEPEPGMLVETLADYEELQRAARAPAGARADARHRAHRLPGADVGDRVRPPRRGRRSRTSTSRTCAAACTST